MNKRVYESEGGGPAGDMIEKMAVSHTLSCRTPVHQLRVKFEPVNRFDVGVDVGITVDGVLCLTPADAEKLFSARLGEILSHWQKFLREGGQR